VPTSFDNSPLMTGDADKDNRTALGITLLGEFGGVKDHNTRRELMTMAANAAVKTAGKGDWAKNNGDFKAHLDDRFYAPRDGVAGKNQAAAQALKGQFTNEEATKDAIQIQSAVLNGRAEDKYNAQFYFTPSEISNLKKSKSFDFSQVDSKGKLGEYELYAYKPDVWKKKVELSDKNIALQSKLASVGLYDGKVDGLVGNRTKEAVKALQRAGGLKPDGIVGKKTQALLDQLTASM